ncbi:MAG: cytochrome c biogenesis protein CcdA [Gemmatimonadota bacterium]|jgi:cytochrome c-type biogenesis protein|nr:cytochrome c biogenesis protein CcdA [Gemmatimonadota bacterium]
MQSASIGVSISFTAGVLSFLSPCVLPLIPSYVSFITGMSLDDAQRSRRTTLVHALLFVTGFTLVFLALGATATVLGRLLHQQRDLVGRVGGVLVILLGLYLMGVFSLGALSRERRIHIANKPLGYLGTVLVGMAFAAGWTPCIGPILGGVLTYTASSADLNRGLLLLFAYSLGLAVPFLAAALMIDRFMALFRRYRGALAWMSRASGALLILIGILMITGSMTTLSGWLQQWTPEMLQSRL